MLFRSIDQDGDGAMDWVTIDIMRPSESSSTNKMPAIIDPSPYYTTSCRGNETQCMADWDGDGVNDRWPLFYDNYFLPRGYAYILAQMNGTAYTTNGCPHHGGNGDIAGEKSVVDWLNGRVPGFTSAMAIGEAMQSLGTKRVALVSPYSEPVNASAKRYFEGGYGLSIAAIEGFAATDSYAIGNLGPEMARDAFARIDRPEIEAFIVPGGNFPTMAAIAAWEAEFGKPVVTTNQAALWAVLRRLGSPDRLPGLGRLLE